MFYSHRMVAGVEPKGIPSIHTTQQRSEINTYAKFQFSIGLIVPGPKTKHDHSTTMIKMPSKSTPDRDGRLKQLHTNDLPCTFPLHIHIHIFPVPLPGVYTKCK
jgi:hypothetical protein